MQEAATSIWQMSITQSMRDFSIDKVVQQCLHPEPEKRPTAADVCTYIVIIDTYVWSIVVHARLQ
jgi:hypothetical protein